MDAAAQSATASMALNAFCLMTILTSAFLKNEKVQGKRGQRKVLDPCAWMQLKVVEQLTGLAMRQRFFAREQGNALAGPHELHVLLHDQQAIDIAHDRMTRGADYAMQRNNLGDELTGFDRIAGTLLVGDETADGRRYM
jgi:hypothetical protein